MESLREADLHGIDLHGADLREADLRGANLYMANLYMADLHEANLCGADLRGANLHRVNLREANLHGVNLDFSCLPLWCGSLSAITDERQRIQIAFHLLSLVKHAPDATDFEKSLFDFAREYANKFHRDDVERL